MDDLVEVLCVQGEETDGGQESDKRRLHPEGKFEHPPHPQMVRTTSPATQPLMNNNYQNFEPRKTCISVVDVKEGNMLARATKALQEHVKDMTEKTKTSCCVSKQVMKENLLFNNNANTANHINTEPVKYITDNFTGATYVKGKLLGKGGFAKCYELTDVKTGKNYAGKIISKNRIAKPHQKEKIVREVELHKNLRNQHVVGFHSYFEDEESVYIVLELCSRKSLVHVLRNRKTLTEPECRYYLRRLIEGCKYIHDRHIIHRDLKLGNMLLNESMNIKIADFGLATRVEYEGEKKMTVCGTPNYIAPEVLQKKGHSYEADIWAVGCVMYAMLVGRPPFETSTLKETYTRIMANNYHIPSYISDSARRLMQRLLSHEPRMRPTLDDILQHDFFTQGYSPKILHPSCCETAPRFSYTATTQPQRPKSYAAPVSAAEAMHKITSSIAIIKPPKRAPSPSPVRTTVSSMAGPNEEANSYRPTTVLPPEGPKDPPRPSSVSSDGSIRTSRSPKKQPTSTEVKAPLPTGSAIRLYQMLSTCLEHMPVDTNPSPVMGLKPLWVTKWVDYSNKYGFGFQLSDKSVGVLFNDTTRMLLSPDGKTVQYNDLSNKVYSFKADSVPRDHRKKSTLLLYFAQYMDEHLIHGGDIFNQQDKLEPIFMKKWFRTGKAIVMYLNNGTLQVNFFDDHTKVILSPESGESPDYLVTYINSARQAITYRLLEVRHFGCSPEMADRLSYSRTMLESIINIEGETV